MLDRRDGGIEEHLRGLEKLGSLCLDEVLEPTLVYREEIVVGESSLVDVVREIVSLLGAVLSTSCTVQYKD